ncbi:MAG: DUF2855 family protein [Actinomycetes bacterium]
MNIEVAKKNLAEVRVGSPEFLPLEEGQARLRVTAFALSSNNITYAVFGEMLSYWQFFPVAQSDATDWGRIPVWGFGEVIESQSPDAGVGEVFYGYFPMSSELVIMPGRSDSLGLTDMSPNRSGLASAYSRYSRCASDPIYRPDREQQQALLYPLFFTSFLIDDFLLDQQDFGSEQVVVSSASSKTALGLAHLGSERGVRVVGLTSPVHVGFVEGLEMYDQVLAYDQIDQIERQRSVYVDIAGNRDVLFSAHAHLQGVLEYSMTVGGTHWDHAAAEASMQIPSPEPQFFFAPTQIAKRTKEWGSERLDARVSSAWDRYVEWADGWVDYQQAQGADEVTAAYVDLLAGTADPRTGYICSL